MTGRVAAVLAAGVSSLFATAALASTGPGYGPYPPAPLGGGYPPPPGYDQQFPQPDYTPPPPPGYAPLPPEAYAAPAPPPVDDWPWPPAYAPSRYGPSYYGSGARSREGHEDYARRGEAHCGPCAGRHPAPFRAPPPPPLPHAAPCPVHCQEGSIELREEVAPSISDAFFYGGMSGGAGPGLEIGGPAGGGAFTYSNAFAGASAHSFAYAYASASAHAKAHGHPSKPGCGCGGKGK